MVIQENPQIKQAEDSSINIREILSMCLVKWYWFIISLAVTICVALIYIFSTPPVYTRSASLLIKEDGKNGSMGEAAALGDLNIFNTSTNINNEILSLRSPAVMHNVVDRLDLDINYSTDGRFYKRVLYGSSCPYKVSFPDIKDNDVTSFTINPAENGQVKISDFTYNGEEYDDITFQSALGDTITTPQCKIVITRNIDADSTAFSKKVYVSRNDATSTIRAYSAQLNVALGDEKSSVINMSINDVNTQRAEDILNTVIAVYNENWIKDRNQVAVSTSMFINERLGVIEQELGNVDESISSFKSENLLPDVQAAASMYMTQSSETNANLLALNTQLSMARYIRTYIANMTDNSLIPANSGIEGSGIEQQISEYNTLQLRRNDLVANSSESNPLVLDMDRSLQNMRATIIKSIDNHMVTLNTQISSLQASEQQTNERLAANPSQGKYLLSIERQQKVKESLYLYLLQKREENELSQAFTAYNTRMIMPPTGSFTPISPNKNNILLIAIVVGLILPIVVIFAREALNTKLRGRKDLEQLSVPFVAEIPLEGKKSKKEAAEEEKDKIVIKHGSRNVINEAFRVLRTNLEFMLGDKTSMNGAPIILVTSFNPGSGKTFITTNTAASFALKGNRVLIVDADMRHGSASAYAGSPSNGLSNYLAHRTDNIDGIITEVPEIENLYILPIGTIPPNPTELLADKRFEQLIATVRNKFDYVFIDCPPIEIVADTQIISKLADRTMFVVRAGLLERDLIPELQRLYDTQRFNNLSLVLNGTSTAGHGYYHNGSYYGYHYGYSEKYYSNN